MKKLDRRHPLIPSRREKNIYFSVFLAAFLLWFASAPAMKTEIGVFGFGGTFVVLATLVITTLTFRLRVRAKQDALNLSLAYTSLTQGSYFLFLRSFGPASRMRTRFRHLSWTEQALSGTWWTIERALSLALAKDGLLVAIGETERTLGAAKYSHDSENWKPFFVEKANGARAIFLIPGDTPSTIWEIKQILNDPVLANKTFFVMPQESSGLLLRIFGLRRGKTEQYWRRVADCLNTEGIAIPMFQQEGMIFQLWDIEMRHPLHDVAPSHVELLVEKGESTYVLRRKWYDHRLWRWMTIFAPGMFLPTVVIFWIGTAINTLAFQPYWIPSGSMKPTLLIGDVIAVTPFPFGYPAQSLPIEEGRTTARFLEAKPKRGDVMVYSHPTNGSAFINRLIGLSGDEVQIIDGLLFINGEPMETQANGTFDEAYTWQGSAGSLPRCSNAPVEPGGECMKNLFTETLPEGETYSILNIQDGSLGDNTPMFIVPDGHVFFMGDNRDNSIDSRFPQSIGGVGFVPFENVIGRADRIIFSSSSRSLWFFWTWRSDRFFRRID